MLKTVRVFFWSRLASAVHRECAKITLARVALEKELADVQAAISTGALIPSLDATYRAREARLRECLVDLDELHSRNADIYEQCHDTLKKLGQ